jgi:hypothetical protein
MKRSTLLRTFVCLVMIAGFAVAQDRPPECPFKTVHLVNLDTAQEAKLTRTLTQYNEAMAKAGYPNARYRLYKAGGQGPYTHLWEGTWSGREEYEKIHNLPIYQEASSLIKDLAPLMENEVYNRFVEIPTRK